MKRSIIASEYLIWKWFLNHFPKPSEINDVIETKLDTEAPLLLAFQDCNHLPNDEIIRVKIGSFPQIVQFITPGELKPTQFLLTKENQISYSLTESHTCIVTDCSYQTTNNKLVTFEIGFCGNAVLGIRILTAKMIKDKLGFIPEAFSAGKLLNANPHQAIIFLLGSGGAVWLKDEGKGEYISIPKTYTKEKIALELSYEYLTMNVFVSNTFPANKVIQNWLEHL
ncbi:MAG: hypothetical protein N2450_00260 [bacterium]|nr:hypothetical protein [bacterium]